MKIIKPTDTTHVIKFTPRKYPTGSIAVNLFNEATRQEGNVTNTYVNTNGVIFITIEMVVTEGQRFQLKISKDDFIIYRGKVLVTSQTPQDLKL